MISIVYLHILRNLFSERTHFFHVSSKNELVGFPSAIMSFARLDHKFQSQENSDSDEEDLKNGKELAGMKVKHNTEELKSGETMILTLADRNILDEKGQIIEDAEELENTLVVSPPSLELLSLASFVYRF